MSTGESLAAAVSTRRQEPYVLRLFVTGMSPRSTRAVSNLRELCETHLSGRYQLDVVDLYEEPAAARADQIVAAPTLVKQSPLPVRRIIGDLSNSERVLAGLGLAAIGSSGEGCHTTTA